jgi:hypothetical protein
VFAAFANAICCGGLVRRVGDVRSGGEEEKGRGGKAGYGVSRSNTFSAFPEKRSWGCDGAHDVMTVIALGR